MMKVCARCSASTALEMNQNYGGFKAPRWWRAESKPKIALISRKCRSGSVKGILTKTTNHIEVLSVIKQWLYLLGLICFRQEMEADRIYGTAENARTHQEQPTNSHGKRWENPAIRLMKSTNSEESKSIS